MNKLRLILCGLVINLTLTSLSIAQSSQNPLANGELSIDITNPVTSKTITVEAIGTVWGSKDDGYPVTHEFDFWQNTGQGFILQFVDDKPLTQTEDIIGYGQYKITIDGNTFNVDYRDCDYSADQSGDYACGDSDIEILYDVSTGEFNIPDPPSSPYIWVRRCDWSEGAANIPRTVCFLTPPAAPQNLALVNAGEFGANPQLSWDANAEPDLAGYHVWRGWQISQSPINWSQIATVTTPTTSYTDNDVVIAKNSSLIHHYKVRAFI